MKHIPLIIVVALFAAAFIVADFARADAITPTPKDHCTGEYSHRWNINGGGHYCLSLEEDTFARSPAGTASRCFDNADGIVHTTLTFPHKRVTTMAREDNHDADMREQAARELSK